MKDARSLHVTALLDHIKGLHHEWFSKPRTLALKRETILSDHGEELLKLADISSKSYIVRLIDHHEFEIIDSHLNPSINLNEKACMCGEFDYCEIPCSHAHTACQVRNIDPYSLCSNAYTVTS